MSSPRGRKRRGLKGGFAKAKCYDDMDGVAGDWSRGKAELKNTCRAIAVRPQKNSISNLYNYGHRRGLGLGLRHFGRCGVVGVSGAWETPEGWRPNPYFDQVLKMSKIPINPARY